MSDYLKIKFGLSIQEICIHCAVDELMEKSSKVKFSSSVQPLIFRLSEDAACKQRTLSDNGSLANHT